MNLDDLQAGGILIVDQRGVQRAEPEARPSYDAQPARRRLARPLPALPGRHHASSRPRALKDLGLSAREVFRCRNFFALGIDVVALPPADRADRGVDRDASSRRTPKLVEANRRALQRRLQLRRERRAVRRVVRGAARRRSRPASYRNITGNTAHGARLRRRGAASAGRPLFLGSYPITPASDILHELVDATRTSTSTPSRPRTRSPASARRSAPRSAARSASPPPAAPASTSRPRRSASRVDGRAAADHHRHPARRPVDRAADQDRAGRPAAGAVRPQRRVPGAGPRAVRRRPTASRSPSRRCASRVKYMTPVHPADRRLPRQRRRAVADPRRRRPARRSRSTFRTDPHGLLPVPARRGDAGAAVGASPARPASSTASAASRRRTSPATSATRRRTTSRWCALRARKVAGIAREIPPTEVHRPDRRRAAGPRLGQHLRRDPPGGDASCSARGHARRARPPALPEPAAAPTSATSSRAIEHVLVPELNLGQLVRVLRAEYLVDAIGFNKVQGQPFKVSEIVAPRARSCWRRRCR